MNNFFLSCGILLSILVIVYALEEQERSQFHQFMQNYNRKYSTIVEYEQRFQNFQASLKRIEELSKKSPSAKFGINKFSDMSREEFERTRISKEKHDGQSLAKSCLANGVEAAQLDASAIPTSFDWRTKNVVTPVKDQGQCGSCWAFSTIGNIESQWAIKGNNLTQFSEQLLVDCSHGCCSELNQTVCNSGCEGGWQWNAYFDIVSWGGVELETTYPYTGVDGSCQRKAPMIAPIKSYNCLSAPNPADEGQMAAYLVANGPLAVALNADYVEDYSSGIIDPWFEYECDPTTLDHAVLIVGYGSESSDFGDTPFWIVKNSWGADWGENGYFRILRGGDTCGISNAVSSVVM